VIARARSAVLTGIALFAATQAGLNITLKSSGSSVADPPYASAWAIIENHPPFKSNSSDCQRVLVLGSSRTQAGVQAKQLSDDLTYLSTKPTLALNFGTPAGGPLTCHLYLQRLFEHGLKSDIVLQEIHPGFLTDPPLELRWLHPHRLRAGEERCLSELGVTLAADHLGWQQWAAASYHYRGAVQNAYLHRWLLSPYGLFPGHDADGHGWSPGPDKHADPHMERLAAGQYADVFRDYSQHFGGPATRALRANVELCQRQGVKLVFWFAPESSRFRQHYGTGEALPEEFAATLGVRVIASRRWLTDDEFSDGHHPNAAGAARLTKLLAAELAHE
jgi:hypothetical protein